MEATAIGIDLGTTNCCVYGIKNRKPHVVINSHGNRTTPSYVAFTEHQVLVGTAARDQILSNPKNTIYDIKRIIGQKFSNQELQRNRDMWTFPIVSDNDRPKMVVTQGKKEMHISPEEVTALLLNYLREQGEMRLGKKVTKAVITVPAYFEHSQRQATMTAAELIGLEVVCLINEPTAAAIAYSQKRRFTVPRTILVYDLGGGTFDASVVRLKEDNTGDVLCVSGDAHLGGEDFVQNMAIHFKKDLLERGVDTTEKAISQHDLRAACEQLKLLLSHDSPVRCGLRIQGKTYPLEMTREQFEQLNEPLFRRTIDIVREMLQKRQVEQIDEILLIGGSSRIPRIQQLLAESFPGVLLSKSINAEEAVAMGAAIYASTPTMTNMDNQTVQDLVIRDVIPHSLGLREENNRMHIFISAGEFLPITTEKVARTVEDDQSSMRVAVFQGENPDTTQNTFLGEFLLEGIPKMRKHDVTVRIQFSVDENGLLTVTGQHEIRSVGPVWQKSPVRGELQVNVLHGLSKAANDQMRTRVHELVNQTKQYAQRNAAIINLNLKLLEAKQKAKDSTELKQLCQQISDWLKSHQNESVDTYVSKLEELKKFA
ncbi:unnamed protein product [Echinostoma caproni]|uniref:Molecular chaperone DnaK n=1 Tax=Echinostoma caproni TaxID=27848 RepID=A0A183BE49_9TREM|nr:unnamed protein product [Echinostoma caproni]